MISDDDLRTEDRSSAQIRSLLKEDPKDDYSGRLQGRSAGTQAERHLTMFQDLRPASGNLPEGWQSSFSAHEKNFKQERQAVKVTRVTKGAR